MRFRGKSLFVLIMFLLSIGVVLASPYKISNPKFTESKYSLSSFGGFQESGLSVDPDMCQEGQDFIVQIDPFGCTPAVVRSDLLEEQRVPVFCELKAIKVNPLINIESIDSISFAGSDYPPQIQTIGFQPSYDALGANRKLNNMMWDNIGYATFILNRQPNESALTNCEKSDFGGEVCWIEGNLSARINYDLEGGFGLKKHTFYLPVMSEKDFSRRMGQYEFFDGRGYLRAENVDSDSATIGVYSGLQKRPYKEGSYEKRAYQKYDLSLGKSTPKILLPGLDCLAGVKFSLDSIDSADTRVRLRINSQVFEIREDEKFLDGNCQIVDLNKNGLNQNIKIKCKTDEGRDSFSLEISPSVALEVGNEKGEFFIGERVDSADDGAKSIYLTQVYLDGDNEENVSVYFMELSEDKAKLTSDELRFASSLIERYEKEPDGFFDYISKVGASIGEGGYFIFSGVKIYKLEYGESKGFGDNQIEILGFGNQENAQISSRVKEPLEKANEDYDLVYDSYSGERYPSLDHYTLDERSLYEKIKLSFDLGQKKQASVYCNEFKEFFPDSNLELSECDDFVRLANSEVQTHDVVIDSEVKEIVFEGISEPSYSEYGAEVVVKYREGGETRMAQLRKNKPWYINYENNEFIMLEDLTEDSAKIKFSVDKSGFKEGVVGVFTESRIMKLDEVETFGSDYVFSLEKINLDQVAKVVVNPSVDYAGTNVEFPFKIGVEKRAIQLSPEKTKNLVNTLNKTIEKWEGISNNLESIVEGMKKACLATGVVLTAKNVLFGSDGKTIARQEVMRGEKGWYEKCENYVASGEYSTIDECFYIHSNDIDSEVNEILTVMKSQNTYIENNQKIDKQGLLGQKVANQEFLAKKFSNDIDSNLQNEKINNPDREGEVVDLSVVKKALQDDEGFNEGSYTIDELKEIDLYAKLSSKYPENKVYEKRLFTALKQVEQNYEDVVSIKDAEKKVVSFGLEGMSFRPRNNEDKKDEYYEGFVSQQQIGKIDPGSHIQGVSLGGKEYLLTLKDLGDNKYRINGVYDLLGEVSKTNQSVLSSYGTFVLKDDKSYTNTIKNPKIKFYETEPYKGLPALVPVSVKEGWYAYIKQTIPAMGNIKSYDDSGRINSFYLCNVGDNGLVEFNSLSVGDDDCQMINLAGAYTNNFPGLSRNKLSKLVDDSVKAIYEASRSYKESGKAISILGQKVQVGEPALDLPASQCADYMSPKDCQIMFNVCDPVICPSSRCDFGGAYPVNDVIQSGIVGSLALCLPNVNEGIYIPVCLTGVKAGIDGLLSVFGSYRDCLSESLRTGQTIGVCDEIHSIYLCEFFWKQGLPLARIAIPKLISSLSGENVRGGAEYSGVQAAFANAQDSVSFFVENYAVNANKAFKARSQEQVGTEVCKSFVSGSYPTGQGAFDVLTEADSPHQFTANFEEIPFSSATNPPTSHYKVFYHIYAGNDRGAYFKVYLRGASSGSYYQDTGVGRQVASGYIGVGKYASETLDFTAPSNYKELCVQVNDQLECGFKQVSTNFAQNYVRDQYMERLAGETDIKTEKECISGSSDVGGLLNLNVQEGVSNVISPDLYNQGIIRVCGTQNPGVDKDPLYGTEKQRWKEVGYCGDESVKCWIDTDTIDDSMNFEVSANQTLEELTDNYLEKFVQDNNYLDEDEFSVKVRNISSFENPNKRILLINKLFEKVFMNNHKAYLYFLRGNAYGELAREGSGFCFGEKRFKQMIEETKISSDYTFNETSTLVREMYDMVLDENCLVNVQGKEGFSFLSVMASYHKFFSIDEFAKIISIGGDLNLKNNYGGTPFLTASGRSSLDVVKFMVNSGADINVKADTGESALVYAREFNTKDVYNYLLGLFRDDSSVYSANYVSQMFEFADGKSGNNLCYKYFEGAWHWTDDCVNVGREKIEYSADGKVVIGKFFVEWKDVKDFSDASRNSDKDFIEKLMGLNYKNGLEKLLERTYENKDRGVFYNSDLKIRGGKFNFNHKKIFSFESDNDLGQDILFKFNEDEDFWYWSYGDEDKPQRVSWAKVDTLYNAPVNGIRKTEIERKMIEVLGFLPKEDKFMNGAMLLALNKEDILALESEFAASYFFVSDAKIEDSGDDSNIDLSAVEELEFVFDSFIGKEVDEEACKEADLASGGDGTAHCFSSLLPVYNDYSGYKGMRCLYSAEDGEEFIVKGNKNVVGPSGDRTSSDKVRFLIGQSCSKDLSEKEKLDLLKPGYEFDFIAFGKLSHSAVFWEWVDRDKNLARIFEWGAMSGNYRTYNYSIVDLSDSEQAVYKINEIILEEKKTENVDESSVDKIKEEEDEEKEIEPTEKGDVVRSYDEITRILGDMTEFNERDRKTFREAVKCEDCGRYGACRENECFAIGELTDKNCEYSYSLFGDNCVEGPEPVKEGCNSQEECQKLIGSKILTLASTLNDGRVVRDYYIQKELGVKSFECLSLMVAMQESSLKFCFGYQKDKDPFYCEGDLDNVLGTTSKGVMQLNTNYIGEVGGYDADDMIYFDKNVLAGLEKLKKYYEAGPKSNKIAKTFTCDSYSRDYYGWKYALRKYNGWACNDDVQYVDNVLSKKDYVVELFPECAFEGEKTLVDLRGDRWNLKTAYEASQMLEGSYDDNQAFVNEIFGDGVINYDEYQLIIEKRSLEFLEDFLEARANE